MPFFNSYMRFMDLFGRNAKTLIIKGYKLSSPEMNGGTNYMAPLIFVGHTLLLPYTLILGAGIKTIIDLATRKEIPQDKIKNLSDTIDNTPSDKMDEKISEILNYKAKSNSSQKILKELSELDKSTKTTIENEIKDKKQEIHQTRKNANLKEAEKIHPKIKEKLGELTKNTSIFFNYEVDDKFIPEDTEEFTKSSQQITDEHNETKAATQKGLLKAFLSDVGNTGKKLQHEIMRAFELSL